MHRSPSTRALPSASTISPVSMSTMEAGATNVSLFLGQPTAMPIAIKLMERHPLGSQAFIPLQDRPWLVLVCGDVR